MEQKKSYVSTLKKSFGGVLIMLLLLLAASILLTYLLPKGEFALLSDGNVDYASYHVVENSSGIPIVKGLLAPVLVFTSSDGPGLLFLVLFILSIASSFEVMQELGGVEAIVGVVVTRFREKRRLLLVMISFLFYCFGAFLGLFEEMITMLPVVCSICLSIGFDSFTGFLCCILSCGFGFASAITNPFTVLLASEIIGVSPTHHVSFRLLIFVVMFGLLQLFLLSYVRKLEKDPKKSLTLRHDSEKLLDHGFFVVKKKENKRLVKAYAFFFSGSLVLIIVSSLIPATRGITVVLLMAYTLVFGTLAGIYAVGDVKRVLKKTAVGFFGGLPAAVLIAIAASIKFVFEEGGILPTIISRINAMTVGQASLVNAFGIFVVILVLEFFMSSSTAKAFFVMGILSMVNTGLSRQMLVLLYTLGDGYTNVIFPTSPVLLISLYLIDVEYGKWIKKGIGFFASTLALVLGFIAIGVLCGY